VLGSFGLFVVKNVQNGLAKISMGTIAIAVF
jgi:hypothetical protein